MPLNPKQRSHLRALAHHLKPVIMIGNNGYTPAVQAEIELALAHHELIKVKINHGERPQREQIADQICAASSCELVQNIGRTTIVYRPATEPKITLPKAKKPR
ncbi:MAG: ribosome assembly RNA-binding protein YhbY [Gammaproteobacteria bacterium]|nr:ribosome assembly RNA-binding protein YhbY [Gammaproteobacteria bacterium]